MIIASSNCEPKRWRHFRRITSRVSEVSERTVGVYVKKIISIWNYRVSQK